MEIKLISFSESKIVSMNVTHDIIAETVAENIGREVSFNFCQTQDGLLAQLKDGFEKYDVVLLAVDVSRFVSTKAALFRALGFKCRLNEKIKGLIESDACMATLNENQIKAHSAIPVGGKAFITSDGLFSGFGIESGSQKFIMVPIDERRIDFVIKNGMSDFAFEGMEKYASATEKTQDSDIPESMEGYVEPIENFVSPVQEEEPQYEEIYKAPAEEKPQEDEFEDYNSSSYDEGTEYLAAKQAAEENDDACFAEEFSILASRGVNVAFARVNGNEVLTSVFDCMQKSPVVQFADFANFTSDDDDKIKENVASNARMAMNSTNSNFAVAISDVYQDEESNRYIFATLADADKSSVFKIFASENETDEELYLSGLESIIEKIDASSINLNSKQFEADYPEEEETKNNNISLPTKIIIWLLIVVALCTLSALIIDTVMSNAYLGAGTSEIISDMGNLLQR